MIIQNCDYYIENDMRLYVSENFIYRKSRIITPVVL